ncbi:WD40-repeat-containing domain protein [Catenaria anguillulae PL171]|uniref:Probable cytosolic iron-sulfur protein assembly protein 1 n=1 Tax=Catenaria anguillulae PL171 TaxID=765915 RepID=A0A1Y2I4E4_9FUNG|nr:WD40-repeat-containing domain protein [Catenaria anguillulae PL171]
MSTLPAQPQSTGSSPIPSLVPRLHFTPLATLSGHSDRAWSLSWHPSGTLLASSSSDKSVRIWGPNPSASGPGSAAPGWTCKATLDSGHKRTVRSVAFSPRGAVLATASFDATIGIWDRDPMAEGTGALEYEYAATLEGHESEAKAVAWSSDGALLATCARDKSVWIWEVLDDNDFECLSVLQEHTQDVKMVKWHPSSELLISCSYDDTIRVWRDDSDDWYCSAVVKGHASTVWAVDFDPSGRFIASVSDDLSLRIWHLASPDSVTPLAQIPNAHDRAIYCVSWCPHRNWIATAAGDNTVKVWAFTEEAGGKVEWVATLEQPHGVMDVNCVAWNPKGAAGEGGEGVLATCGDDGEVRLWKVQDM